MLASRSAGEGDDEGGLPPLPLFIATLGRAMPGRLALALSLTAAVSVTEGVGLLVLVPLLHLIGLDVQQGTVGNLARGVGTVFGRLGLPVNLVTVLAVYVGLVVTHASLVRWQTVTDTTLQLGFMAHLRKRVHRAVMRASWLQLVRTRSSDLVHAMTGQIDRVGHGTSTTLQLALNGAITVVYLVVTFYVSAVVTALVISAGCVLTLILKQKARAATLLGKAEARVGGETYGAVLEHVGGIKVAKSYGAEERSMRRFTELADTGAATGIQAAASYADAKFRFDIGVVLVLAVILYVAIEVLAAPPAGVLVLLFAFARVMPRVSALQQGVQHLLGILPDFSAVVAVEARLARHADASSAPGPPLRLRRAVRLESVSFRYDGEARSPASASALADVTLTIPAGETTAIVGPSGSGKSTLADLLLGLILPERGRILVDETPLTPDLLHAWRGLIGYVPQDTFLFHDTVRANLLWARPDASEAELRETLAAAAAQFVDHLPDGLDTVLGDRGVRLSGGERQRLALARALLRRPAVLILDEATSSLDSENERRVQDAFDRLHGRLTIVVFTHRLATVRQADCIHVLEAGRLVESGTWSGLLNGCAGRFRSLCEAQGLAV